MNGRIKELLLQNKDKFTNGVTITNGEVYIHGSQENLEKLTELIIREGVTKMASEIMNNSWIDDAVQNTYKYFGVNNES